MYAVNDANGCLHPLVQHRGNIIISISLKLLSVVFHFDFQKSRQVNRIVKSTAEGEDGAKQSHKCSLGSWKVQNDKMLKFVGNVGTDKVLRSLCAVTLKNLFVWHAVLVASSCFHADGFDSCSMWTWSQVKHSDWERCWKELQTQARVDFFNVCLHGRFPLFIFYLYFFISPWTKQFTNNINAFKTRCSFSEFQFSEHSSL